MKIQFWIFIFICIVSQTQQVIQHCAELNDTTDPETCTRCNDNYFYNPTKTECFPVIEFCHIYNQSNYNECQQCEATHHLNNANSACLINIPYCREYKVDNKSKCQSCEDTYLLKTPSETLCYPQNIPNCQDGQQNEEICNQCNSNSHPNDSNTACPLNIEHCTAYQGAEKVLCQTCQNTHHIADIPDSNLNKCYLNIADCTEYEVDHDFCKTCQANKVLTSHKRECKQQIENCLTYNNDYSKCNLCKPDYHLQDETLKTICAADIPNCVQYKQNDHRYCDQCEDHYKKVDITNGSKCDITCDVDNCEECENDIYCKTCKNTGCLQGTSENCFYYQLTEDKLYCQITCKVPDHSSQQKYLCKDNECSVTECAACDVDHYIGEKKDCKPCDNLSPFCATCDDFTVGQVQQCKSCLNDSTFMDPSENICRKCNSIYSDKSIQGCIKCQIQEQELACLECQTPIFFKSANRCINCQEVSSNCLWCLSADQCEKCIDGYYLTREQSGGSVIRLCKKCSEFNSSFKTCEISLNGNQVAATSCLQGFYLQGNTCSACIENCNHCSAANQCLLCNSGYIFNSNTCKEFTNEFAATYQKENIDKSDYQEVFEYAIVQSKILGNEKDFYQFNQNSKINSDFFCTQSTQFEDNECNAGKCQTNYCQCGIRGFGNRCQFNTAQKSSISEFLTFSIQTIEQITTTAYESNVPDELNLDMFQKLQLLIADLSMVLDQETYINFGTKVFEFYQKFETYLDKSDIRQYYQIYINLVQGLIKNTEMSEEVKREIQKFEQTKFLDQLHVGLNQRQIQYIQRDPNNIIKSQEINFGQFKGTIHKEDVAEPKSFLEIKVDNVYDNNNRRMLSTQQPTPSSIQNCDNTLHLKQAKFYILESDFEKIKQSIFNKKIGDSNDITFVSKTYFNDIYRSNFNLTTAIAELTAFFDQQRDLIVDDQITIYHHIPKLDIQDAIAQSRYECYGWDVARKEWNTNYIAKDQTKNCHNYVICASNTFGSFAAKEPVEQPTNTTDKTKKEGGVVEFDEVLDQPGFIINLILIILYCVSLCVFRKVYSFNIQNAPRKKIHLPQLTQAYKQKRDMDTIRFQQNQPSQTQQQQFQQQQSYNPYLGNQHDQVLDANQIDIQFTDNGLMQHQQQQQNFLAHSQNMQQPNPYIQNTQILSNNTYNKSPMNMSQNQPYQQQQSPYLTHSQNMMAGSTLAPPAQEKQEAIEVAEERSIKPWMLYHGYSLYHTPQYGIRCLKLSLILSTLQFYLFTNCLLFSADENPATPYVILFILLSMMFTWIFNYVWGFIAHCFKSQQYGSNTIHPLFWLLQMALFIGLWIGCISACFRKTGDQHGRMVLGFFIDIIVDFILFDLFIVFTFAQINEESQSSFIKCIGILKYRGYYDCD